MTTRVGSSPQTRALHAITTAIQDHKIVDRAKIRDGHVANRPVYVAIAVTADGYREILGLWAGDAGEGAKYWQSVLTEIKNRGVRDVLMLVCDGLTALPGAVNTVWPQTVVQTCVVHLIRATEVFDEFGARFAVREGPRAAAGGLTGFGPLTVGGD
jgi:transposase-like protein